MDRTSSRNVVDKKNKQYLIKQEIDLFSHLPEAKSSVWIGRCYSERNQFLVFWKNNLSPFSPNKSRPLPPGHPLQPTASRPWRPCWMRSNDSRIAPSSVESRPRRIYMNENGAIEEEPWISVTHWGGLNINNCALDYWGVLKCMWSLTEQSRSMVTCSEWSRIVVTLSLSGSQ